MLTRRIITVAVTALVMAGFHLPPAHATSGSGAVCEVSIKLEFTPAITTSLVDGDVDVSTSGSICAGTALLAGATVDGLMDGPRSCAAIEVVGTGTVIYPGGTGGVGVNFVGSAVEGVLEILPGDKLIAGAATLVGIPVIGNCLGTGISSITYVGTLVFVDPEV